MRKVLLVIVLVGGAVFVGLFSRLFGGDGDGGGGGRWDPSGAPPPWGDRPSIYEHVAAHVEPGTPGLTDGGERLPDEEKVFPEGGVRWVAGGLDGTFVHHGGAEAQVEAAAEVGAALRRALRRASPENVDRLYAALTRHRTLEYVDPLLERLTPGRGRGVDPERLHTLARWLVTEAPDREPVKAGIALLGVLGGFDDRETLMTLGRHEEFTLYVAVALANEGTSSEADLFTLAKNVSGWGRIHVVERLAETRNPEIRRWLLREGYRNDIMYEYLAYTCAVAGELHRALRAEEVDGPLLVAAGELIAALIRGGPAAGIDEYEHAADVIERYLAHVRGRAGDVDQRSNLTAIRDFLRADADWATRGNGWTERRRSRLLGAVEALLDE